MLILRSVLPDRNPTLHDSAAVFHALDAICEHVKREAMAQPVLSERRKILYSIWHDVMEVKNQVEWKCSEILEEQRLEGEDLPNCPPVQRNGGRND